MAYYHVHGLIPDTLAQSEGYQLFEQYIANGAPKDNFDGFELISRVHAPQTLLKLGKFLSPARLITI